MKFYAVNSKGAIMTDDYSPDEILRGDHIEHIKADMIYLRINGAVKVYDENNNFIRLLMIKETA